MVVRPARLPLGPSAAVSESTPVKCALRVTARPGRAGVGAEPSAGPEPLLNDVVCDSLDDCSVVLPCCRNHFSIGQVLAHFDAGRSNDLMLKFHAAEDQIAILPRSITRLVYSIGFSSRVKRTWFRLHRFRGVRTDSQFKIVEDALSDRLSVTGELDAFGDG